MEGKRVKQVQQKILDWYKKNKRELPWRNTTDPYQILISEVMLQQTQVDRVIPYYLRFLKKYPKIQDLAKSEKKGLLSLWSGLGYNSRALRLKTFAEVIVHKGSSFPETYEELIDSPGIGPYTANAILAFAYNKEVPVIDTNIRRVLIHELNLDENISSKKLEKIAMQMVPKGKSRIWHNAIMDYGALYVTAKKTGIGPISKQSMFKGSTRSIRGKILRHLLQNKSESISALKKLYPHQEFDVIINKMLKERLIIKQEEKIFLE